MKKHHGDSFSTANDILATMTTSTSSSRGTESPSQIQKSGRRANSYYQVRLSLRVALLLIVLPHLAGRWIQQHRTVWAAAIREMGTAIILQFVPIPVLDETRSARRNASTTTRQHQERDEEAAAKTPVFEATSGSSVVHHWYSNSSTPTTTTAARAVQGRVPVDGPTGKDENTMSNFCVDGSSSRAMSPTATSDSSSSCDDHNHHHRRHHHHEPAAAFLGQHLLVDLDRLDAVVLASEARLAQALVQLAADNSWTMLSYRCHSSSGNSSSDGIDDNNNSSFGGHGDVVSCVAVLLESHVSLYAFPARGILALDIFMRGRDSSLLSLLPYIETMFGGMPSSRALFGGDDDYDDDGSEPPPPPSRPHMAWSHKRRGFSTVSHEDSDYHRVLGCKNDEKTQVVQEKTALQDVQIVDIADGVSSPEDRALYLDGVLQSRRRNEAVYHEALVHAGMVVHPHPQRVAVVGGGAGAILREVLKHNTVEEVVMIEMDESLIAIAREYLPEWSDCTSFVGSPTASCFDDPRVTIMFTDAVVWFMKHFGSETSSTHGAVEPFDVIILDAL
jgi:S-adenosylmethionine/arginine decarboxylase-like enzyme